MKPQTKPRADTLVERVDKLVQAADRPIEWGNPLSSMTPQTLAIRDLASRTEALEKAVREIALEVQRLTPASTETLHRDASPRAMARTATSRGTRRTPG
jgi:hypothetical protein